MKRIYILIAIILFLGGLWTGVWWATLIAGALLGLFAQKWSQAFLIGLIVPFLVWGAAAGIIDYSNQQILSERLAELMSLPSPYLLILMSALTGALLGSCSMSTGFLLKKWFYSSAS